MIGAMRLTAVINERDAGMLLRDQDEGVVAIIRRDSPLEFDTRLSAELWDDFSTIADIEVREIDPNIYSLYFEPPQVVQTKEYWYPVAELVAAGNNHHLRVAFRTVVSDWNQRWRLNEFIHAVERLLPFKAETYEVATEQVLFHRPQTLRETRYALEDEQIPYGIVLAVTGLSEDLSLLNYVATAFDLLDACFARAEESLLERDPDVVHILVDVPDELRSACEQYLIYFAEFLRDAGVKATSSVQDSMGSILFSVRPEDPDTGLDRIRQALAMYLRLPVTEIIGEPETSHDQLAFQKLEMTIHHLRAQLAAAKAMLTMQEATIQAQALSLQLQARLLPEERGSSTQPVFGGAASVTDIELKGVTIHAAEIYRKLRKLFRQRGPA